MLVKGAPESILQLVLYVQSRTKRNGYLILIECLQFYILSTDGKEAAQRVVANFGALKRRAWESKREYV